MSQNGIMRLMATGNDSDCVLHELVLADDYEQVEKLLLEDKEVP